MLAVRVKGKSTRSIRPVYVLVNRDYVKAIEMIITSRTMLSSDANDYLFKR